MIHRPMQGALLPVAFSLLAVGALSGVLACTPLKGRSDQPEADFAAGVAETSALEGAVASLSSGPPADWSCLGTVAPAPPGSAEAAAPLVYSLQVLDLATQRAGSGMLVRACGLTDVECEQPVAGPNLVGADGWVHVSLFEGFTGYLEVIGPEVMPGVVVLSEPLTDASTAGYPYFILSAEALSALGRALNVAVDPNLGVVSLRVFDCQGVTAAGVQMTKVGPGAEWYFVGGLPSAVEQWTDSEGFGGFANAPPGLAQVDALTSEGVSISGPLSMLVRPGWVSHSFVHPLQLP